MSPKNSEGKSRGFQFPWRSNKNISADVDSELSFHLDMRVQELVAQGMSADEARTRAQTEFGDIEFTRRYCRDLDQDVARKTRFSDRFAEWRQDAHYAWRSMRRNPGFAVVSLLTLALAIGANTAIFSVVRAVLLKPLPYSNPDEVVGIFENMPDDPKQRTSLSPPNYVDYRAQQHTFASIAAYQNSQVTWRPTNGDPSVHTAILVSPNMFDVLKVRPLHGRSFVDGEEKTGNDQKVVLAYKFWRRELNADATLIGKTIVINDAPRQVIGIMPEEFTLGYDENLYQPLDLTDEIARQAITRKQRWLRAIGRLRPGVSIEAATADLRVIASRLEKQYPEANTGRWAKLIPLHDVVVGDLRPAILLLQGAAIMVLLIACANLANITLSRTMGRRREIALRAALGAGRGRLIRQLLTESVMLSFVGGVIGVTLAIFATKTLLALNPETLPAMFEMAVDGRVLAFSIGLSIATGVVFGLVPALDVARTQLHDSLKEGGRGSSGGKAGERLRRSLVVAQVGLAVMLLVGAGLLIRSFGELTHTRLGFEPDHVLTGAVRASGARYDDGAPINILYDNLLNTIAQSPGVEAVGSALMLPSRGSYGSSLRVEGEPADETKMQEIRYVSIRGDYFKAMRIPLLSGRYYDATDVAGGPKTTIINQAAVKKYFPKGDALGRRIRIGPNPNGEPMTIIGIVGDIRDEGLDIEPNPTLFANHRQEAWDRSQTIVIRTKGNPASMIPVLRNALHAADPALALRDVRTMEEVLGASLANRRFALGLVSSFALVALTLAAIGIYGVLAYSVSTRMREFGVRMALGATSRSVLMLVLQQGVTWSIVGLAVGVAGAIAAGRLLTKMLYGVTPLDATTYVGVVAGLLAVAIVACIVPAARATRVDLLTSMRAE